MPDIKFTGLKPLQTFYKDLLNGTWAEVTASWTDGVVDNLSTTGSVTSAVDVVSVSNAGYSGGSFQLSSVGSGNTIVFQQSNDGTNWVALQVVNLAATTNTPVTSVSSTAAIYTYASQSAFVRATVTAYGSGTVTVTLTQKRAAMPVSGLTVGGGTSVIGNLTRAVGYTDSTATIAGSGSFTGTARSLSTALPSYTKFNAIVFADQAGTLFIEQSLDTAATWQVVATAAAVISTPLSLSVNVTGQATTATQYRVRFANGVTTNTLFRLSSSFAA